MKTKRCARYDRETAVAYRFQLQAMTSWLFACRICLVAEQKKPGYRYGGTWKGVRH